MSRPSHNDVRAKRLKISGKTWTLVYSKDRLGRDNIAECDTATRTIVIHPDLAGAKLVGAALHEGVHATLPDLSEEATLRVEADLLEVLQAAGLLA